MVRYHSRKCQHLDAVRGVMLLQSLMTLGGNGLSKGGQRDAGYSRSRFRLKVVWTKVQSISL